jgi:gas vesicle protein
MQNHERNFSLSAFLVGGILGTAASLLFTPKSGKDLRADVKRQIDNYLREVKARTDSIISSSRSASELLKRTAEDLVDTVKKYAAGKVEKPVTAIEKEIAGLKAAILAAKASFSIYPDIQNLDKEGGNGQSDLKDFEDETLPKHIGMGKGRSRKSFYS